MRQAAFRRATARQLAMEPLEDRNLLAVVSLEGGTLVFNNDGIETNSLRISLSDSTADLVIADAANPVDAAVGVLDLDGNPNSVTVPLTLLSDIQINTHQGDDTLTIDHGDSAAQRIPLPINYDGGPGGFDTLEIQGGGTFENAQYDATGPGAGGVELDGYQVSFTNLEPIAIAAILGALEINIIDGQGHEIVVEDAIGTNNTVVTIDGGLEDAVFLNPTNVLAINAGDGEDHIIVKNLEANFTANVVINGGNDRDTFEVLPSVTAPIRINGGTPVIGDADVPPGDVLALGLDDVIGADVQQATSSGLVTSASHQDVAWINIETVVAPDRFERNESIAEATVLGSPTEITLRDLSIHPRTQFFSGVPYVDVVVVVDETGSMSAEHAFLADFIPALEQELVDAGIGGTGTLGQNQYGLVGFGEASLVLGHTHPVGGGPFGSAVEFAAATTTLVTDGIDEEGYDGIRQALTYPFRPLAERLIILVTDDGRTVVNPALNFATIDAALGNAGATLHGILNVDLEDGNAATALAVDADGTAYLPDGTGGVIVSTGGVATGGPGDTISAYVNLIWNGTGLVGDLNQLSQGGLLAQSFSDAMLTGLINTLESPLPPDRDIFQYTASATGKLVINAFFEHSVGNLNLRVTDANGNAIAASNSFTDDEQIVIPVVTQERYFIEVAGADNAVGNYELEIENFAAPVPNAVVLDPLDDTGMMNSDNVTSNSEPRVFIEADLADFAAQGIDILDPDEVEDNQPGAAVEVLVNGTAAGYATPIPGTNNTLFEYTFDQDELSSTFIPTGSDGGLNFVKAAVRVFDGQLDAGADPAPADGRTQESEPLLLTIDTTAPDTSELVLLASSDTGMDNSDMVTNKMSPAFSGVAEENAKVFLYATPTGMIPNLATANFVGEGVANGFAVQQGLGRWEITSEPLADGAWDLFAVVVDAAGNSSYVGPGVPDPDDVILPTPVKTVRIDTAAPNTPYLDLLNDTGHGGLDNITSENLLQFLMIGDDTINGNGNPFYHDVIYRLYWRPGDGDGEVLVYDSWTDAGINNFTELGQLTQTVSQQLNDPNGNAFPDGVHNFKLEIEDRAGNISPDFLLEVEIVSELAASPTIDLIASSDTGMYDDDNVTAMMEPAFTGLAGANSMIRIYAKDVLTGATQLVGEGVTGSDLSDVQPPALVINGEEVDGEPDDGVGVWEVTVEPLDDGVYDIIVESEDWAGNADQSDPLRIEIDTIQPNTPLLDLDDDSDTGRHGDDNVTNNNTPAVAITTHDPNANFHIVPDTEHDDSTDYLKYRIWDRFEAHSPNGPLVQEFLLYDSAMDAGPDGVDTAGDMFTSLLLLNADNADLANLGNQIVDAGSAVVGGQLQDGVHSLKVEVEDRAGNISPDFLLNIEIDTQTLAPTIDLLAAADSGMYDDDNVTAIRNPAFSGLAEANAAYRVFAQRLDDDGADVGDPQLVGEGFVGSDKSDELAGGTDDDGWGLWEHTIEDLTDGPYDIFVQTEDAAGNVDLSDDLRIEIDTIQPNTPLLDLDDDSDTGRHDDDNITNDTTPAVAVTTHDPNANFHIVPDTARDDSTDYLKYRIWDRFEAHTPNSPLVQEFLLYDSALDAGPDGVDTADDLFTSLLLLNADNADLGNLGNQIGDAGTAVVGGQLQEGLHSLKVEVEDRAGNISSDFLLNILIDTTPFLGDGDLHTDSDSGVPGFTVTTEDLITNVNVPDFFGVAEANNIVTVAIDGVPAGTGVAVPLDGDDALQPPNAPHETVEGNWRVETNLNLIDGEHSAVFTFEDPAGNRISTDPLLFFVDTEGPRITAVEINAVGDPYDLFDPKPTVDGPTPAINSLVISVSDLPDRTAAFLYDPVYQPTALEPGHYQLVGDASGVVPIDSVTFTPLVIAPGEPATGYITLNFDEPLPDDRFTLTISDSITDVAGNALDGETNAAEPQEDIDFPSGDGSPGGDFLGRFTVDTRAELGVWAAGSVYVDTNGNFGYDPEGTGNDDTNEDIVYVLGYTSDNIFAGNFVENAGDSADGFDKLGAYGYVGGKFRWMIDTDNNGVPNVVQIDNAGINGLPVAGNFDGNADNGDEVVIKEGYTWHFDTDHNFQIDSQVTGNIAGLPVVGDFDGNGTDDLGGWADDTFQLDTTGDGNWDFEFTFGFIGVRERPIAADFDGDGIDDLGLWVPDRTGATPEEDAEWYILVSDGDPITDRLVDNPNPGVDGKIIDFIPQPFGKDIYAKFGDEFALPVVGNYDPPVAGGATPQYENYTYTNPVDPMDVNGDGNRTPLDVLWVVNLLNDNGESYALETFRSEAVPQSPFPDSSGDLVVSPLDVLLVVDALNHEVRFGGEGEAVVDPLDVHIAASPDAIAFPSAAIGQVELVSQADDAENTKIVTHAIAYRQAAREEPEIEFLYDAAEDAVEKLLDDLAEDIAGVWAEI